MEINKFIKVYDDIFHVQKVAALIKYAANKIKFEDAGVVGNNEKDVVVQKQIRKTQSYNFNDKSLSSYHWGNYLRKKIRDCFQKYETKYDTSATIVSSLEILKYDTGGFYNMHTDNHAKFPRTISVIIFLNNDYEGGELNFHDPITKEIYQTIKASPGRCVLWPSNFMYPHSVSPVTKGTRYAIVSWLT